MTTVFEKHQIRIAKQTLKMSDAGAQIMGGMTKVQARHILRSHGYHVITETTDTVDGAVGLQDKDRDGAIGMCNELGI